MLRVAPMIERQRDPWIIILAGGSGARLSPLTRALYGVDLPKQFAVLAGGASLLQSTMTRARQLTRADHIVVVVTEPYDGLARSQLALWPGVRLLVQGRGLDTGPGLALPLAVIRELDPAGRVIAMPADHHFARPSALIDAAERAAYVADRSPSTVVLLGATADMPDTEYGWIEAGGERGVAGARPITRFVEKPDLVLANQLFERGALWNTFIMAARVEHLWQLCVAGMPQHCAMIEAAAHASDVGPRGPLAACYRDLPPVNFSKAVLERAAGLVVLPLRDAGWSDWGTPARVFASLRGTPDHDRLLGKFSRARAAVS